MSIDWVQVVTAEARHAQQSLQNYEAWKVARKQAVDAITVDVDGLVFDGDETSQNRMARAVAAADNLEDIVSWTLADNSTALVSAGDLKEALRLAGLKQTEIWIEGRPDL